MKYHIFVCFWWMKWHVERRNFLLHQKSYSYLPKGKKFHNKFFYFKYFVESFSKIYDTSDDVYLSNFPYSVMPIENQEAVKDFYVLDYI